MINILLSTYNGERYLRAQIDSLLQQKNVPFKIYVRDDGSTDGTRAVIADYTARYKGLICDLTDDRHRGYPDCFWDLLSDCPKADAYAFCDQDDIWEPEKLERAQKMLETVPSNTPALYIHDYRVCDGDLKVQGTHTIPDLNALPSEKLLFYSYAEGFSMVLNEALRAVLLNGNPEGKHLCHDEWTLWTAYFHGRILHDATILASYRRHEDAYTTTGSDKKGMIRSWLKKEISGPAFAEKCTRIAYFANTDDRIPAGDRKAWLFLSGKEKGPASHLRRLFYPHRLKPTIGGELALRILFLIH